MKKTTWAVLIALLAIAPLGALGMGAAQAAPPAGACSDEPFPEDAYVLFENVTIGGVYVGTVYVGIDRTVGPPTVAGMWVCTRIGTNPLGWQNVGVGYHDQNASALGGGVETCVGPQNDCSVALAWIKPTGAEVANPATSTNAPFGGAPGTGGAVGTGTGTCLYVHGTPTCPASGLTLAGVTVQEGDAPTVTPTTTSPPPACTGVNNSCPGAYVIVGGDRTNDTVTADVAVVGRVSRNIAYTCVQVNSICPP